MTLENQKDAWSVCQPGTLTKLSQQVRRQARRRQRTKLALAVSGVLAASSAVILMFFNPLISYQPDQGAGVVVPDQNGAFFAAHLSCPVVLSSCDNYLLGALDGQVRNQIRLHLGHCAECDKVYRARAQELQVEYSAWLPPPTEQLPPVEESFALFVAR